MLKGNIMDNLEKYQREYMGYKDDKEEYKKFKSYYEGYTDYCSKEKLIPVSRDKFMQHLKTTIDKEVAQEFMDMMHTGKKLGECKEHFKLTFDEVDIIIKSTIVTNSYFGKKVNL